jgi:hypothetical protein
MSLRKNKQKGILMIFPKIFSTLNLFKSWSRNVFREKQTLMIFPKASFTFNLPKFKSRNISKEKTNEKEC